MLIYKSTFLKYNNLCTIMSFNASSINIGLWNIRNSIRYLFFFLLKKAFFLRLFILYKLFFFIITFKKILNIELNNCYFYLFNRLLSLNRFLIDVYYFSNYLFQNYNFFISRNKKIIILNNIYSYYYSNIIQKNIISYYNYFFFLYKTFVFIICVWLYSIKFLNFYNLNVSSIPTKKKIFTVLKSPHKDKTSREKFKINKIKKRMSLPSFIGSDIIFLKILNETISIKYEVNIKK